MSGEYFVKWREELPRARVDDKTIRAIIAAKTKNPNTPNRTLAKKYMVSETTVSNFTVHLKRGEHRTLDELRLYVSNRYLKERCVSCEKSIKRGNDGLCRLCYAKRNRLYSIDSNNTVSMKSCDISPNQYHYWVLDVYSKGKCKYCEIEKQYYPWEESQIIPLKADF